MTAFGDISLLLGAILGIAAVYIVPTESNQNDGKSKVKDKKKPRNPVIVVSDENNNEEDTKEQHSKSQMLFGETTILDMISIIRSEISILLDNTGIRVLIPDATPTNSTSNEDENANMTEYTTAADIIVEPGDVNPDDTTVYNNLPNSDIYKSIIQRMQPAKKKRIFTGIKDKRKFVNPNGQSTMLEGAKNKNVKDGFVVSVKNPKTPVRRVFRRMMNILRFKNNASKSVSKTPEAKSPPTVMLNNDDGEIRTVYF